MKNFFSPQIFAPSRLPCYPSHLCLSAFICGFLLSVCAPAAETGLPVTKLKRTSPVDFDQEILPILKNNCLACHNQTQAKAGLILETPQSIAKGGDNGPAVVPKKPARSLLWKAAAHLDPDLKMPPRDNKVAAVDLRPEELGLLQLWVEQGAKGSVRSPQPIAWQPIAANLKTIYAVALVDHGRLAAFGRGNQIFLYHLPGGPMIQRLRDPSLEKFLPAGAAHRDTVNSLAASSDGQWVASGGYREIKLWKRQELRRFPLTPAVATVFSAVTNQATNGTSIFLTNQTLVVRREGSNLLTRTVASNALSAVSSDGRWLAVAEGSTGRVWNLAVTNQTWEFKGDWSRQLSVEAAAREALFAKTEVDFFQSAFKTLEANQTNALARQEKAAAAHQADLKLFAEKEIALTNALKLQAEASKALDDLGAEPRQVVKNLLDAEKELLSYATNKPVGDKAIAAATAKTNQLTEAKAALEKLPAETKAAPKAVLEKINAAAKAQAEAEKEVKRVELLRSTSGHELELAQAAWQKSTNDLPSGSNAVSRAQTGLQQTQMEQKTRQENFDKTILPIQQLAVRGDGAVAVLLTDGSLHLWQGGAGHHLGTTKLSPSAKLRLAFTGQNQLLLGNETGNGEGWELNERWKLERVIGNGDHGSPLADRVNALAFTADGSTLVSGGGEPTRGGEVKLWRVRDGTLQKELFNLHSDSVLSLAISADGKSLATGGADRFAKVTDLATGRILKTLEGHTHHVMGVGWKRDGRTVLTAGGDNLVKPWDLLGGERRKNIDGFSREVTAVQFVGVSNRALVGAGDGQVLLVTDGGEKVRSYAGARDFIYAVAATPDERTVIAGGADGVLRVWNGLTGKLDGELSP